MGPVGAALAAEFADAPDLDQFVRIVLRLLLAGLLGGLLGYQRERIGKAAGVRTHMLVALGAALFVLVPERAGVTGDGLARVIQGLAVGIGFLGAGAIVKQGAESSIQGLTTAAGIWLTSAIGMACGLGRASTAILAAVLAWTVLALVPHVGRFRDS
jgi:putative Mg2+ transporter-C (MgtC) family protein